MATVSWQEQEDRRVEGARREAIALAAWIAAVLLIVAALIWLGTRSLGRLQDALDSEVGGGHAEDRR